MFYVKICQFSIGLERFKDGQKSDAFTAMSFLLCLPPTKMAHEIDSGMMYWFEIIWTKNMLMVQCIDICFQGCQGRVKFCLPWYLAHATWIWFWHSSQCITLSWKSFTWCAPMLLCIWCLSSLKPPMIPIMIHSGLSSCSFL